RFTVQLTKASVPAARGRQVSHPAIQSTFLASPRSVHSPVALGIRSSSTRPPVQSPRPPVNVLCQFQLGSQSSCPRHPFQQAIAASSVTQAPSPCSQPLCRFSGTARRTILDSRREHSAVACLTRQGPLPVLGSRGSSPRRVYSQRERSS